MLDKNARSAGRNGLNEEVAEFLVAEDIYEQADAMIDLMYFALGTMVEMGTRAGRTVRNRPAGLTWPEIVAWTAKPHYNPKDGKVIKPDTWEDPAPKNPGLHRCRDRPEGEITSRFVLCKYTLSCPVIRCERR